MPSKDVAALLVIDVQNDFCRGGALAVQGGEDVVAGINQKLKEFPVRVLTQDWHPPNHSSFASNHPQAQPFDSVMMDYGEQTLWPDHCVFGSKGAAFHPDLNVDAADMILRKGFRCEVDSYSAFFENDRLTPTGLVGYLQARNVTTVCCVGLATDYCVCYSAVDASELGFRVSVDEALCAAIDLDGSLDMARNRMREHGVSLTSL